MSSLVSRRYVKGEYGFSRIIGQDLSRSLYLTNRADSRLIFLNLLFKRLTWALFVLWFSTLVCCKPTESILLFVSLIIRFFFLLLSGRVMCKDGRCQNDHRQSKASMPRPPIFNMAGRVGRSFDFFCCCNRVDFGFFFCFINFKFYPPPQFILWPSGTFSGLSWRHGLLLLPTDYLAAFSHSRSSCGVWGGGVMGIITSYIYTI